MNARCNHVLLFIDSIITRDVYTRMHDVNIFNAIYRIKKHLYTIVLISVDDYNNNIIIILFMMFFTALMTFTS